MDLDVLTADRLAQVIQHAVAPAFPLGAVAGFVSILMTRMGDITARIRSLNAVRDDDTERGHLKIDIQRLKVRMKLLNQALYLALASAICATLLIIVAIGAAFVGERHEPGVAILFVVSVGLLGASLFKFLMDVKIALHELDYH